MRNFKCDGRISSKYSSLRKESEKPIIRLSEESANCLSANLNPKHQDGLRLGPHSEAITQIKNLSGQKLFCRISLLLPALWQPLYSWRLRHCLSLNTKPNLHCTFNHRSEMCCALSHSLGPPAMVEGKKLSQKKSFCGLPLPLAAPMQPYSTKIPKICLSPNPLPNYNASPNGGYGLSVS